MSKTIETARLILRPWNEKHIEHLVLDLNRFDLAKWITLHGFLTMLNLFCQAQEPIRYVWTVNLSSVLPEEVSRLETVTTASLVRNLSMRSYSGSASVAVTRLDIPATPRRS